VSHSASALLVVGAGLEFVGIMLVAAPDFLPTVRRAAAWLSSRFAGLSRMVRRLLRRPRVVFGRADMAGAVTVGGHLLTKKSCAEHASLEEKVAFLITRDEEAQRDVQLLELTLKETTKRLEQTVEGKVAGLRRDLTSHVAETVAEYRRARIFGAVALAAGLACTTWANFV
jgi:hypothetical protein